MGKKYKKHVTTKRGKLSKAEIFYVSNNPDQISAKLMARELNRSVTQINKYINTERQEKTDNKETVVENDNKVVGKIDGLMGKHMRNGKPIATVMTMAASEAIDSTRTSSTMSKTLKNSIHKPKK